MPLNLLNSRKRIFVCPDRIHGLLASNGDALVDAVAFIGAVGNLIRPFQLREINIVAWNVLNGGIHGFPQREGVPRIRNYTSRCRHDDTSGVAFDGNRAIWAWKLTCFSFMFLNLLLKPTSPAARWGTNYAPP